MEERGYHLENNQRDLTTLQKLFLGISYPVYAKFQRQKQKEFEKDSNFETDPDHEDDWKKQYTARRMQNAQKRKELKHG